LGHRILDKAVFRRPEKPARTATSELEHDDSGESVVVSGAADKSFNGKYFGFQKDREHWKKDDLIGYRHTAINSKITYLWCDSDGT
jgi:hypothetical protein